MKKLLFLFVIIGGLSVVGLGQNYKIKQTRSMGGQTSETTVYVKGSRKRTEGGGYMGFGGDVAEVEQCDLKRTLKISDKKKAYAIEPFDDGSDDAAEPTPARPTPATKQKTTKGGTLTMTMSVVDTGERKQMFGLTARHVKTTMTMSSSPDACQQANSTMERDGWYVDLPEFSCPMTSSRGPSMPMTPNQPSGGCRDRVVTRTSGGGKTGFALVETTTMSGGGMGGSFSMSINTLEFSKTTLADSLFDIPAGYSLVDSSDKLYGRPDYAAMAATMGGDKNSNKSGSNNPMPTAGKILQNEAKKPGTIRVGVLAPTNPGGENVSTTNLQMYLAQKLTIGNVEGIAVGSEADARSRECDYIVSSDFSKLRQSTGSKIGGFLGKVTNTDTSGAKSYEVQVDFVLTPLSGGKSYKNKSQDKTQNDVDRAAETALALEAEAILGQIRK